MPLTLNGKERGVLAAILIEAFPDPQQLKRLLMYRLNRNMAVLAGAGSYEDVLFEVLQKAAAEYWVDQFLVAVREENPGNPHLAAFAAKYGGAVEVPQSLEVIVKKSRSLLDPDAWRTRLAELEARVCRVEVTHDGEVGYGTAFLVGPRVVLTNFHVVQDVIEKRASPADIRFRFDYKIIGGKANDGRTYLAAPGDEWLIEHSSFSAADSDPAEDALPASGELDFALIRLAERVGEATIGDGTSSSAPRGWIPILNRASPIAPKSTMHILQHPDGGPLKLALGEEMVIGENANGTRVRYETSTLPGSSGSPGFDANWELTALHHAGDPRFPNLRVGRYNRGIPITAVIKRLTESTISEISR